MAQSLARALEGLSFPCDRAQLIEYARANNASSKALDALEAVPQRRFSSMTELLEAIPSKNEMRRRPASTPEEAPGEAEPAPALAEGGADVVEFPFTVQPPNLADPAAWLRLGAEWSASYVRMWHRLWGAWLR